MISRRDFLKLGSSALASSLFIRDRSGGAELPAQAKTYKGSNLAGWDFILGDSIYPEDGSVTWDDIKTVHQPGYSELRANIHRRRIMAHNITFKRILDPQARKYVHTCSYEFRLPFIPQPDTNSTLNAETLEGALFVWDGATTRRDYGIGFQWALNPFVLQEFGNIRTWTDIPDPENQKPGTWVKIGKIKPDLEWHRLMMIVDYRRKTTALLIDNKHYLCYLTRIKRPGWGPEVAARFQAEIVSIYPEPAGMHAMHKAQFRNWVWKWEPSIAADSEADLE
jgi:hypothetical protein